MSDSRVKNAIAEGRVPSDVNVALLYESRDSESIGAIIALVAITFFVVSCRLLSRGLIIRRFGIDDVLALVSMLMLIAFAGLCIELINMGSGRHFDFIRWVLTIPEVLETQSLDFIAHVIYTIALLLCRFSGLAFYYRLCGLHDRFLLAIKIVAGILTAGFLPQIFLLIFHCRPVTTYWPYGWEPIAGDYTCLQWGLVYSVNSSVSLLCDLLLFGIPVAMLRILEMSRKRKIQLACILLPGIAVIAISIARLVLVILGQWQEDQSWSYNPMLGVETSEIGATLIALSVPGAKPLFDRVVLRKSPEASNSGPSHYYNGRSEDSNKQTPGRRSERSTRLSTMRFASHHNTLGSQDQDAILETEVVGSHSHSSQEELGSGIYVKMDFDLKEARTHR